MLHGTEIADTKLSRLRKRKFRENWLKDLEMMSNREMPVTLFWGGVVCGTLTHKHETELLYSMKVRVRNKWDLGVYFYKNPFHFNAKDVEIEVTGAFKMVFISRIDTESMAPRIHKLGFQSKIISRRVLYMHKLICGYIVVSVCTWIYAYMCVSSLYLCMCINVYMCHCTCVCIHVCVHKCVCVYMLYCRKSM